MDDWDDDDYSLEPEDEARFLDVFSWEKHLGARDRWLLFVARSSSEDFAGELADAGGDPRQRALVRLEAELSAYS